MTKKVAEQYIRHMAGKSSTQFITVRFGNVLGSNGSVVPLFQKQIEQGGPVTITHPDMDRFFMLIPEAVGLILQAGAFGSGGDIFMLEMGKPIKIFNKGNHLRDFTYIDDVVSGVIGVLDHIAEPDLLWDSDTPKSASSRAPYRIYNIGNQQPVELLKYIEVLEKCLGRTAKKNLLPMQPGDVPDTWADVEDLVTDVGYRPTTPIEEGIKQFIDWYIEYYKIVL